jgi:hypothetical protein
MTFAKASFPLTFREGDKRPLCATQDVGIVTIRREDGFQET